MTNLVNYALIRGVRIIPEADAPAHSRSWALSANLSSLESCGSCNWTTCAEGNFKKNQKLLKYFSL